MGNVFPTPGIFYEGMGTDPNGAQVLPVTGLLRTPIRQHPGSNSRQCVACFFLLLYDVLQTVILTLLTRSANILSVSLMPPIVLVNDSRCCRAYSLIYAIMVTMKYLYEGSECCAFCQELIPKVAVQALERSPQEDPGCH